MLPAGTRYGGFWKRFGALLLDGLIVAPITALGLWGMLRVRLFLLYSFVPELLFTLFYCVFLVGRFGGTPGKRLLGLRIVTVDGDAVGYRHALLRCAPELLLSQLASIGMILASFQIADAEYHTLTMRGLGERLATLGPSWLQPVQHVNAAWTWGELFVLLTNRQKRALHDFIAGTVVIDESSFDRPQTGK